MKRHTYRSTAAVLVVFVCALWAATAFATVTPVAYYRLGEDDAGATAGAAGNNPTTAYVGTDAAIGAGDPMYSFNTRGSASSLSMGFDDSADYYTAGVYNLGTDNWGMEGWVYSTDAANGGWAFANGRYLIGQFGGSFLWHRNGQGNVAAVTIDANVWHHMALVRDGGVLTAYLDGTALASTNRTDSWDVPFAIGARGWDGLETWAGQVDDVRLFTFSPGQFDPTTDLMTWLEAPSAGGSIQFVGSEVGGAGVALRDTAVAKAFDTAGGEYYAGDGYIFWATNQTSNVVAVGPAGTSIKTDPSGRVDLPDYITDIVVARDDIAFFKNNQNNDWFNDPAAVPADGLPESVQTGGILVNTSTKNTPWDFITITLGDVPAEGFRLGIHTDVYRSGDTGAQYLDTITVKGTGGVSTTVTSLPWDGLVDLHFFDITGFSAGDTLTIGGSGDWYPVISGLTFDPLPVPEPSALVLLAVGLAGIVAFGISRKRS